MSVTPPDSPTMARCPETPYIITDKTIELGQIMEHQKNVFETFFGPAFQITHSIPKKMFKIKAVSSTGEDFCAKVGIYKNEMYIESLGKCGEHSGTTILRTLLQVAKCLNIENIFLEDASKIKSSSSGKECEFDLWVLHILTTGQSWYNKHGFISDYCENEFAHNSQVLNTTLGNFINTYFKGELKEKYVNGVEVLLPGITNQIVPVAIEYIVNNYLKTSIEINCNDPVVQWLLSFLTVVRNSPILQYCTTLKYDVGHDEGKLFRSGTGGKLRTRSKKRGRNRRKHTTKRTKKSTRR
jgi:hypothetical protein